MKPDFYTKAVLTVIAAALVALVMHTYSFVPVAHAGDLPLAQYAMVPVNPDGSINVTLPKHDTMLVDMVEVNHKRVSYPMDVNIANCADGALSTAGPMGVDIEDSKTLDVDINPSSSILGSSTLDVNVTNSSLDVNCDNCGH